MTGGEILEQNNNTVTIKWNEKGIQNLSLSYSTSGSCSKTTSLEVKVDATLSVDSPVTGKNGLIISPVPNNGNFTMTMSGHSGTFTLTIYDVNGKAVYKENKIEIDNEYRKEIHTHLRAAGLYYLVLHNSEKSYKVKFLIH